MLELNEGQAAHSLLPAGQLPDRRLLGRAAGAAVRGLARGRPERSRSSATRPAPPRAPTATSSPRPRSTGSRSTPSWTEVGRRYFDMGSPEPRRVHNEDARPWLRRLRRRLRRDRRRRLPPALHPVLPGDAGSSSSWSATGSRPGGVVIVNVGHPEGNDDLERVLGRTMADGLPDGPARPGRGHEHAAGRERGAGIGGPHLSAIRADSRRTSRSSPRSRPARLEPRLPGGEVYTDDRAPVEWLIDRSILGYAAEVSGARVGHGRPALAWAAPAPVGRDGGVRGGPGAPGAVAIARLRAARS